MCNCKIKWGGGSIDQIKPCIRHRDLFISLHGKGKAAPSRRFSVGGTRRATQRCPREASAVRGAERSVVAGETQPTPKPSPARRGWRPRPVVPPGLTCSGPWKQILQMGWWCWCWCPARWSPPPPLLLLRLLHTERVSDGSPTPSPPAPAAGSPGPPSPAAASGTAVSGRRLGPSPASPAADTSWPAGGRGSGGGGGGSSSAPLRRGATPAGGSSGPAGRSGDAGGAGGGGR